MCGINGFNFQDESLIRVMNQKIKHRGPDGDGVFTNDKISLGHTRLSIIDLSSAGSQPMISHDRKQVIVFNGEIYNYQEIKKELSDFYPFKTDSDTEVILAAYKKWGEDCVKKFNGIFAFAIWDEESKKLFLARDHFGVKPLFYYFNQGQFIFSSEIKSILEHNIKRELNQRALNLYFRFLYIQGPETIWQNIYKLPPASSLCLKNGQIDIKRYWQVESYQNYTSSKNDLTAEIKSTMQQAVKRQIVADVPVGVYLSGGIDSTSVLGLMSECYQDKIKTFSIGFDIDNGQGRFNIDSILAKKTAAYYQTDHHELIITAQDMIDNLDKIVWHMDDLVANPTQVSMFLLSKLTKENNTKVVLSGDGGDELFGGYDRYYYYDLIRKFKKLPAGLQRIILNKKLLSQFHKSDIYDKFNAPAEIDIFLAMRSQKEKMVNRFLAPTLSEFSSAYDYLQENIFPSYDESIDLPKRMMKADLDSWLVDESLAQSDKTSMAWGVEQRVPILDKEVVALAMRVPTKYKIRSAKKGKWILREAMKDYLPDFVFKKEKTAWFSPTSHWFRTDMKDMAYEILSPNYNQGTAELFDFQEIKKILDDHIAGRGYALSPIWSLIIFQVWYRQFAK